MILPTLLEAQNEDEFVRRGTELLTSAIRQAIDARGRCVLGLSGGSTPRKIYAHTGADASIDWKKVWIFLVDERHIPPISDDSNTKLVHEAFVANGSMDPLQFIAPDTALSIDHCVGAYDAALQKLFTEHGTPDVLTLGLGEDGHIASLFPPLGDEAFGPSVAIHTTTDRFAVHDRISVTLPTLRQTPLVFFFLKGEGKQKVWQEMMAGGDARRWPARHVMEFGQTTVLMTL